MKIKIPQPTPNNIAGEAPRPDLDLERVGTHGPVAAVYYPELKPGETLAAPVFWPLPIAWLSPLSMVFWPVILDVDRIPFIAWNKRIGQ
jgi:hypothetical protein